MSPKSILIRLFFTVAVLVLAGWLDALANPVAMIGAAHTAGLQMSSSDVGFIAASLGAHLFSGIGAVIAFFAFLTLLAIWWRTLAAAIAYISALGISVILLTSPAFAFYNATDTTEAYGILPNHTAFWIPGTGDTKDGQAKMESEDFLRANKVAGKFFIIPHIKLTGSTYMGWDKYIPAGRLIVVDRAPFFHEWTKKGRGTDSAADQSFPCHSKDNIEVSAEMSLAASVTEDNAAKFLFYFGVNAPAGDAADPNVIFTSVFQGRNLGQVMGGWGRGEIQSRVCRHINEHTIEDLALNGNKVLDAIQAEAQQFFLTYGITIEYVGWAGGFTYPAEVSSAINTRFAADHIRPTIDILQAKSRIDALNRWDGHLPTSLTFLGDLGNLVAGFIQELHPSATAKP